MDDLEFFAKLNPQKFTSLIDDFKSWRKEFHEDENRNALKSAGKLKNEAVEATYERCVEEGQE